jgi:hypothetical protein
MTLSPIQNFEARSLELYSLAFLLTGNTDRSLQAFNRTLDGEEEETTLFGNSTNRRARKLIIVEALDAMEMELEASRHRTACLALDERSVNPGWKRRALIATGEFEKAVLAIDAFPRCAILLTIFERISLRTAAILLNADHAVTQTAQRIGALQLSDNLSRESNGPYYRPARNQTSALSLN